MRGTTENRNSLVLNGSLAQGFLHIFFTGLVSVQIFHHQIIIELYDLLHHLGAGKFAFVLHVVRNINNRDILPLGIVVNVSLHLKQIHDSLEVILFADRAFHNYRVFAQLCNNLMNGIVKVRAENIHLVDESDTRNIVGISLTPYILGLGLNAALRIEYADCAVQYTKGTLYLNGKIYVSGCINNIDTVFQSSRHRLCLVLMCPVTGSSRRSDSNTTLLLLLHPVHGRGTFIGLADFIVYTGVVQNTLCQSGFSRIDMRHDTNVPGSLKRILSSIVSQQNSLL